MAPMTRKGSLPFATSSGSGALGDSWERSCSQAKNLSKGWRLLHVLHSEQPTAKAKAVHTSLSLSGLRTAKRRPKCDFDTVTTLCKLTAQGLFIPSASVNRTSEGTPRMVEVTGATVTEHRYSMAPSLVRTTTGLCLSGRGNR